MFQRSIIAFAMFWAMTGFLPADAAAIVLTTGSAGGGIAQTTIQPSLALNPLIRVTGGDFYSLGEVTFFGGNFAPAGWAEANGQLLPIASNTTLFSKIGTTYGGDGRTTFALPDLRGRTAIGDGNGPGLSPQTLGQRSGAENVSLPLPAHDHTLPSPPGGNTDAAGGGGQTYTNMQPSLGLNYVMPLAGLFPSRSGGGVLPEPTLGFVELYASGSFGLPSGYTSADGQLLPIIGNEALFSLIGTIYGGDGRTNFALPDLRDRTVIGEGNGTGLSSHTLGQRSGVETVSMSEAKMASHNHALDPSTPGSTGNTGGNQPQTNMQPTLALQYLVALNAPFPGSEDPFLGEIGLFAGNFIPGGWAAADGQILLINEFPSLFSLFGALYGGDGRTTFALPDLRGRLALGDGQGPGLSNWFLGQRSGVESLNMSEDQMQAHAHTYEVAVAVPEPATLGLLVFGLAGLGFLRRRKLI